MQDNFNPKPLIWPELLAQLEQHGFDTLIALDMTASETVSRYYPDFAQLGIHIIAANKFAGAADSEFYQRIKQTCRDHQVQWRYNATVGAGLPIQSSIQMLRQSGDRIQGFPASSPAPSPGCSSSMTAAAPSPSWWTRRGSTA